MRRPLITALLIGLVVPLAMLPVQAQRRGPPAGPPNPFAGNSQAIAQGEQSYNQNCTSCHGPNGGAGEIGPEIVHNLSVPLRGELDDNQILDVIRNGAPGTAMPGATGRTAPRQQVIVSLPRALRAPGNGSKARSRRSMTSAGWRQSIVASALAILAA